MNYLNEKLSNKSRKMRLMSDIKKDIISKICNLHSVEGQELARLVRYLTKTPLWNKGITETNEIVLQPDLLVGIDKVLKENEDVSANSRGNILIPYAFSEELLKEEKILIFIQSPKGVFKNHIGKYQFVLRVAYMDSLNVLEPYGDERALEIASRLCDMFDETYTSIEKEIDGEIKTTSYKYTIDETIDFKLSKQGYSMRDIVLSIESVVLR